MKFGRSEKEHMRNQLIKPKIRLSFSQVVCLLLSVVTLLFPIALDWYEQAHNDEVITHYTQYTVDGTIDKAALMSEADAYNLRLANEEYDISIQISDYYSIMSEPDRPMCWVEFPRFDQRIPVYHGTSPEVLQMGAGHLERTSLPVGGPSTHTVITGHSGLPHSRMFDEIDQFEEGDIVILHSLGEDLAYKVIGRDVVLPNDTSTIGIEKGRDLLSLITCTPYGINTHRLIIHCERTELEEIEPEPIPGSILNQRTYPFFVMLGFMLFISIIWWRMRPKEFGHTVHGLKRFKRHDWQYVIPVLPKATHLFMENVAGHTVRKYPAPTTHQVIAQMRALKRVGKLRLPCEPPEPFPRDFSTFEHWEYVAKEEPDKLSTYTSY